QELRRTERGALDGDGEIAREGEVQPAALANAVDADEDDLRTPLELEEGEEIDAVGLAVEPAATLVPPAHLAADAEPVSDCRDDENVGRVVALGQHGRLLQAVVHLDRERVPALGPVDDDTQDAVLVRGAQVTGAEIDDHRGSSTSLPVVSARPDSR